MKPKKCGVFPGGCVAGKGWQCESGDMVFDDPPEIEIDEHICTVCGNALGEHEGLAHIKHEGETISICCPLCMSMAVAAEMASMRAPHQPVAETSGALATMRGCEKTRTHRHPSIPTPNRYEQKYWRIKCLMA